MHTITSVTRAASHKPTRPIAVTASPQNNASRQPRTA